jgi:hypothetical protein
LILSADQAEINELYDLPKFTEDERRWYFELQGREPELQHRIKQILETHLSSEDEKEVLQLIQI